LINDDGLVKVCKAFFPSFPWKRESSLFNVLPIPWIPACAGMTTFYEMINDDDPVKSHANDGFNCRGAMRRARYRARAACPYDARRAKTEKWGADGLFTKPSL